MALPLTLSSIPSVDEEATGDDAEFVHFRAPPYHKFALTVGFVITSIAMVASVVIGKERVTHAETSHLDGIRELFFEAPCKNQSHIQLGNPIQNNLGGQGEEGIIYPAVYATPGLVPQSLLLHVNAKQKNITTYHSVNGMQGQMGRISIDQGSSAMMTFSFVDENTSQPVILPEVEISFYDLDTAIDGLADEYVKLNGLQEYYLTDPSNIISEDGGNNFVTFKAKCCKADPNDNPTDPLSLTIHQKRKTVTVKYTETGKFDVELGSIGGNKNIHGPRLFNFVFKPSLLCAKTSNGPDPEVKKHGKKRLFEIRGWNFSFPWFF